MAAMLDWRRQKDVVKALQEFESARKALTTFEDAQRVAIADLRNAEVEQAKQDALLFSGKGSSLKEANAARLQVAQVKRRLEELTDGSEGVYSRYAAAEKALEEVGQQARSGVWDSLVAEYVKLADALDGALQKALDANTAVEEYHRALTEQFSSVPGTGGGWVKCGDGRRVGGATFKTWRLSAYGLQQWRAHRVDAGTLNAADRAKREAAKVAEQMRRLAHDAENAARSQANNAKAAVEGTWYGSRDFGGVVKVSMRGVGSEVDNG